jgi:ubiquitin carboxyl-terminal hydrolase 9/13
MAIGKAAKWISFATPQSTTTSPTSTQTTLDPTLAIADEKQFGLENVRDLRVLCLSLLFTPSLISQSLEIPGMFSTPSYCPCLITFLLSYANSVLQALYFCSPFRDLVLQSADISAPPLPRSVPRPTHPPTIASTVTIPRRKSERGKVTPDQLSAPTSPTPVIPTTPPTLFSALRSLYVYISKNPADKGTVAPRAFIDKLRDGNELFRGAMHQDAHEFLNYLLNKIVEEIQYDKHHKYQDVSPSNDSGEDCECVSGTTMHSYHPCRAASPHLLLASVSCSVATLISNNAPTLTVHSETSQQQSGTLVHRLFEGTLTSETRCLTCETVSRRTSLSLLLRA